MASYDQKILDKIVYPRSLGTTDSSSAAGRRKGECPNENASVIQTNPQGTTFVYALGYHAQMSKAGTDATTSDLFRRADYAFESEYRANHYRWNELQTYNRFILRCMLMAALCLLLVVLSERMIVSRGMLQILAVVLVVSTVFMAVVEYSLLRMRARSDFSKIRF